MVATFNSINIMSILGFFIEMFHLCQETSPELSLILTFLFPQHIFSSISLHDLPDCISLTFYGAFPNVPSNCVPERMQTHIGCICIIFVHCAPSNVSSHCLQQMMQNHTGCICLTFLHCAVSSMSFAH